MDTLGGAIKKQFLLFEKYLCVLLRNIVTSGMISVKTN